MSGGNSIVTEVIAKLAICEKSGDIRHGGQNSELNLNSKLDLF